MKDGDANNEAERGDANSKAHALFDLLITLQLFSLLSIEKVHGPEHKEVTRDCSILQLKFRKAY